MCLNSKFVYKLCYHISFSFKSINNLYGNWYTKILNLSTNYVITSHSPLNQLTPFAITNTQLYVPVVA